MSTGVLDQLNVLTPEQVEFYNEHGYLHIPQMFTQAETDELSRASRLADRNLGDQGPGLDRSVAEEVHGRRDGEEVASSSRCTIFSITPMRGRGR